MIGEIRKVLAPFYDSNRHRMSMKGRPALVLAKADEDDYAVLPISRISRQENRDPIYDIKIDPAMYPALNLRAVSYVRTHKQTTVYRAEIGDMIGDMKGNYEDLYLEILTKREEFSKRITEQALE